MAECDAIKFKVRVYEEDSVLWTFAEKSGMTRRENTTQNSVCAGPVQINRLEESLQESTEHKS